MGSSSFTPTVLTSGDASQIVRGTLDAETRGANTFTAISSLAHTVTAGEAGQYLAELYHHHTGVSGYTRILVNAAMVLEWNGGFDGPATANVVQKAYITLAAGDAITVETRRNATSGTFSLTAGSGYCLIKRFE